AAARAVGPGEYLEVMTGRVLEVDAAAAVVVVDLAGSAAPRIGPVLQTALLDTSVDVVEFVLGHQEGVVLRMYLLVLGHLRVVEADTVVEPYREERTELLGCRQAEELGE